MYYISEPKVQKALKNTLLSRLQTTDSHHIDQRSFPLFDVTEMYLFYDFYLEGMPKNDNFAAVNINRRIKKK